jgi:hypothetical protein
VDGFAMLRNSNSREISREFFLVLVKTLEFCPFFAILCQEQGMSRGLCREFAIFDPTESKQEGYEENQDLAPLSREFAGNFFEGGTIFHA